MILIPIACATSGCRSSAEKAAQSKAAATQLFDIGDYSSALRLIRYANAQRDDDPDQWLLLARIELALNKPIDALDAYTHALDLSPSNPEALQLSAELNFQLGRPRAAIELADRLLALDPSATRARFVKGLVALDQRQLDKAQALADEILRANARDDGGLMLKARAIALGGDLKGASAVLDTAQALGITSDAILSTRLRVDRSLGNAAGVFRSYEQLIARHPDRRDLILDYAKTSYRAHQPERARTLLRPLFAKSGGDPLLARSIANLWIETDDAALDATMLKTIDKSGPDSLRIAAARWLIARRDPRIAQTLLAPVDSTNTESAGIRALAFEAAGDYNTAFHIAQDVLKKDKSNLEALSVRARFWAKKRQFQRALADAQLLVSEFPEDADVRILLTDILTKSGDLPRSRRSFEEALQAIPLSVKLPEHYVQFLYLSGDKSRVLSVSQEFVRRSPSSEAGWRLLEHVCRKVGDKECAEEAGSGKVRASKTFEIDTPPGALDRGLLSGL